MSSEKNIGVLLAVICITLIASGWTMSPSFTCTAFITGAIGTGLGSVWMLTLKYASR